MKIMFCRVSPECLIRFASATKLRGHSLNAYTLKYIKKKQLERCYKFIIMNNEGWVLIGLDGGECRSLIGRLIWFYSKCAQTRMRQLCP